jgi:hypothetical protein
MILDAFDRELGPVAGLFVLHVELEGDRDAVDDSDVREKSRSICVVALIAVDFHVCPEVFLRLRQYRVYTCSAFWASFQLHTRACRRSHSLSRL